MAVLNKCMLGVPREPRGLSMTWDSAGTSSLEIMVYDVQSQDLDSW